MRLVDDKGKLFGLINLIDLLVVLLVIGVAVSIKIDLSEKSKGQKIARELYVKVLCRVSNEVANNDKILKTGDVIMGGNAKIMKVLDVRPANDAGSKDAGYSYMVVLIKANCVMLNNEYYCANMPIKINANIIFSNPLYIIGSTTNTGLAATIVDVDMRSSDKI